MKNINRQAGFTAIELLITLFVAAAFLIASYQLFNIVIKDGGQARSESRAGSVAYDYMRRYSPQATNPCSAQSVLTNSPLNVDSLSNATITVSISCPEFSTTSLSKINVSITYNTPQQTVSYATYVNGNSTQAADVTDGLVAWWKLNGDATTVVGSTNGSITGATTAIGQNSLADHAYSFNGTSNYINIPTASSLDVGGTFSISAWVYPTSLAGRFGIFTTRTSASAGSWQLEVGTGNGGTNRVTVSGSAVYLWDSSNSVMSTGSWHHLVFVKPDNSTLGSMYVNGTLRTPLATAAYTVLDNASAKQIGTGTSGSQFFAGRIDDVRLYNRVLSAGEVTTLYTGGAK